MSDWLPALIAALPASGLAAAAWRSATRANMNGWIAKIDTRLTDIEGHLIEHLQHHSEK